jgi:hypothetical protein
MTEISRLEEMSWKAELSTKAESNSRTARKTLYALRLGLCPSSGMLERAALSDGTVSDQKAGVPIGAGERIAVVFISFRSPSQYIGFLVRRFQESLKSRQTQTTKRTLGALSEALGGLIPGFKFSAPHDYFRRGYGSGHSTTDFFIRL